MMDAITGRRSQDDAGAEKSDAADDALDDPACGSLIEASAPELSGQHDQEGAPDRDQRVQAHAGRLELEPPNGGGSAFVVELPLDSTPA